MIHLPPLRLLVTFDSVARLRSMQRAADELNVTPPAVTQAIRALEDHIGVPLLDRSTKPARLNAAGERLAQATRGGMGTIAEMIEELRFMAGLTGQHLTVSCTIGMATYWLMPRLPDFYAKFDGITVNVQAPPSDLPSLAGGIDVALRYGTNIWADGDTEKLFDEIVCPVGIPPLIKRIETNPAQLSTSPLIHVRTGAARHWAGWSDYLAARALPKPTGPSHQFDNYIHAVQAALDGRGIMLGLQSITQRFVTDGALVELKQGQHSFGTSYFVTTSHNSKRRKPVAQFVSWLQTMASVA
ncbi:LysR substrate-binding domain-containing protein [Pseudotabrizicola sp. L79]|uniref:LysR substrate-binding domain-containing protein n=1 Tax=Pseudotabrizicola sp. L79 TaxID=3118402 RepID=UPI002F927C5A